MSMTKYFLKWNNKVFGVVEKIIEKLENKMEKIDIL